MTDLRPYKAGAAAVDPSDYNTVIDEVTGDGGGGITEITSNDLSVTVTNPNGPTVDVSVSGGSQPFESLVIPIAFDTPGLQRPCTWSIIDVNQGAKRFDCVTSNGDGPDPSPGATIAVTGSTGNDGTYTVVSTSVTDGVRSIIVVEAIPDATADGLCNETGPAGIKLCDLNAGDLILSLGSSGAPVIVSAFTSDPFVFNGNAPYLQIVTTANRGDMPGTPPDPLLGGGPLDVPSADIAGDGTLLGVSTESGSNPSTGLMIECAAPTSLWIYADDNGDNWTDITAGAANLRVLIVRAA